MNRYKVHGEYTISFEMEVEAEDEYGAVDQAYDMCDIDTEWNGNSVFSYGGNCELSADGEPFNIKVTETIEENIDEDDEEN